jgi:hypothetical protein
MYRISVIAHRKNLPGSYSSRTLPQRIAVTGKIAAASPICACGTYYEYMDDA